MTNNIKPPIVILTNPRSGSSAMSAILDAHGVWNDKIGGRNRFDKGPNSYCSFEWRDMKQLIRPKGDGMLHPISKALCDQVDSLIKQECPPDKNWLFKGIPEYFPAFEHLNPKVIAMTRNRDNIIISQEDKANIKGAAFNGIQASTLLEKRFKLMEDIVKKHKGRWIDADKMMAGDFGGIKSVFKWLGIEFDEQKALGALDMDKWHFRTKE